MDSYHQQQMDRAQRRAPSLERAATLMSRVHRLLQTYHRTEVIADLAQTLNRRLATEAQYAKGDLEHYGRWVKREQEEAAAKQEVAVRQQPTEQAA